MITPKMNKKGGPMENTIVYFQESSLEHIYFPLRSLNEAIHLHLLIKSTLNECERLVRKYAHMVIEV